MTSASYKLPGAGFRSTPTDLVKLTNAYSNGFISKEVVSKMFQSNTLGNGEKTKVGITWRNSFDIFGNLAIEHAGSWRGTRTVLVYYSREQLAISLMINANCQVLIEETAHILAQLFRTSKKPLIHGDINQKVEITLNSQKQVEIFQGTFQIKGEAGQLEAEADNFLSKNNVLKISDTAYAMATEFGLLYLEMNENEVAEGKVYAYTNRNEIDPKEKKPLITFKIVE